MENDNGVDGDNDSSSSTEVGNDGSIDENTDNDSIDDLVPNNSMTANGLASKILIDKKERSNKSKPGRKPNHDSSNGEVHDQTTEAKQTKAFIDDVLKEFDSPVSIHISKGMEKMNVSKDASKHSCASLEGEDKATPNARKATEAMASQIIKENSEILERIMRKRANTMSGTPGEITVSLSDDRAEEKKDEMSNNQDTSNQTPSLHKDINENKPTKSTSGIENHNQDKLSSSTLSEKNSPGKLHNQTKHFPAVSSMAPAKPQLAKPQLNPVGGMVVQQRSDVRMGGQPCTKPITFNPFPNSSRIGQRKSNEVGRKLGLYPAAK